MSDKLSRVSDKLAAAINEKTVKVAEVTKSGALVINAGEVDGIRPGQDYMVYEMGNEIFDPDTHESLGRVEIIKGRGRVTSVQRRLATLQSVTEPLVIKKRNANAFALAALIGAGMQQSETIEPAPFAGAKVGDLVRKV